MELWPKQVRPAPDREFQTLKVLSNAVNLTAETVLGM